MRTRTIATLGAVAVAAALTGCSGTSTPAATNGTTAADTTGTPGANGAQVLTSGDLVTADGSNAGKVEVTEVDGGLQFTIEATGLTPGFHGLHLHAIGKCEPKSPDPANPTNTGDFLSSGGHLDASGGDHPHHDGDMPSLMVGKDGSAHLVTRTDRVTREALSDADGAALVVHAQPDNYANIPTRYASAGADAETKKAGDAGPRVACAVITAS